VQVLHPFAVLSRMTPDRRIVSPEPCNTIHFIIGIRYYNFNLLIQ